MSIIKTVFITTVFVAPAYFCGGQTAPNAVPATATGNAPAAAPAFTPAPPSNMLKRSLDEVHQVMGDIRLEKWKKGSVREAAETNIEAIQRDMQGTLPSLLKDADATPGSLSKVLPLSRNVDALYDVIVHLVEQARVSGTSEDAGQLQTVMGDLERARVVLDNQITQIATMQEKQIVDLRTTVQKQDASLRAAAAAPPPPKCPAPAPARKRPARKKPSTTPPAGSSTNKPKTQ